MYIVDLPMAVCIECIIKQVNNYLLTKLKDIPKVIRCKTTLPPRSSSSPFSVSFSSDYLINGLLLRWNVFLKTVSILFHCDEHEIQVHNSGHDVHILSVAQGLTGFISR